MNIDLNSAEQDSRRLSPEEHQDTQLYFNWLFKRIADDPRSAALSDPGEPCVAVLPLRNGRVFVSEDQATLPQYVVAQISVGTFDRYQRVTNDSHYELGIDGVVRCRVMDNARALARGALSRPRPDGVIVGMEDFVAGVADDIAQAHRPEGREVPLAEILELANSMGIQLTYDNS